MTEQEWRSVIALCREEHQTRTNALDKELTAKISAGALSMQKLEDTNTTQNVKLDALIQEQKAMNQDLIQLKTRTIPALSVKIWVSGVIQVVAVGLIMLWLKGSV